MIFQLIISGVALGSIYAFIALGIVLIYKATDVVNFGQGEFTMLGAFVAYHFIGNYGLPFWLSCILTFIFMAVFAVFVERVFLRIVTGENVLSVIMVTLGLAIIIRTICGMKWGHEIKRFPIYYSEKIIRLGDISIAPINLWTIISVVVLVLALYLLFTFTKIGVSMRATSQNQFATYLMGIKVETIVSITWILASVISAIAGILVAPVMFLSPNMSYIGLKAFPAAILGGFASIPGAIVGGIIIGLTENFAGTFLPEGFKNISGFIILIIVLMLKPEGIFGKHEQKKV